jgi:hypothetical protein
MLVDFQTEVFTDGIVRLQLRREDIPLTPRLRGAFSVNKDKEYIGGFKYILTKNTALSTHYDSDMGWGFGLTPSYLVLISRICNSIIFRIALNYITI